MQVEDLREDTLKRYRLFGVTLASNFDLFKRTESLDHIPPELTITRSVVEELPNDWTGQSPAYISPYATPDGESMLYAYRQPERDVFHFPNVSVFDVWPDRIAGYELRRGDRRQAEMWLRGTVLSFWLERQGIPAIHASAVVVEDRAVGFMADSTTGKSSVVAALMQHGHPLLTDDVLAIERHERQTIARSGYPEMRLWPDLAEHFIGSRYENLELDHPDFAKRIVPIGPSGFGTFCDSSQPLRCIYLLSRRDPEEHNSEIKITPVSPREALIELVRYSFVARILTGMGLQPQRMSYLGDIARQVPVRQITYPSGLEQLPRVTEAILRDERTSHP